MESGKPFHENNPYYRLEMGKLDLTIGNTESALEHFEYASENEIDLSKPVSKKESNSLKSEALRSIGEIYLQHNDPQEAENYLAKAIEIMPHNSQAILDSAKIAFESGDKMHCRTRLHQMAELPDDIRPPRDVIANALPSKEWRNLLTKEIPGK